MKATKWNPKNKELYDRHSVHHGDKNQEETKDHVRGEVKER